METDKVYRVQNSSGGGCYANCGHQGELVRMRIRHDKDTENHPTPSNDGATKWRPNCLHGFESLESLRKWFSDAEIELLESHGFYVCELRNVQMVQCLRHQVLFRRTKETSTKILEAVK